MEPLAEALSRSTATITSSEHSQRKFGMRTMVHYPKFREARDLGIGAISLDFADLDENTYNGVTMFFAGKQEAITQLRAALASVEELP
jgi:hypothetical protein